MIICDNCRAENKKRQLGQHTTIAVKDYMLTLQGAETVTKEMQLCQFCYELLKKEFDNILNNMNTKAAT